jgi:hypothetical protein
MPLGNTRGMFSSKPPPVMWASFDTRCDRAVFSVSSQCGQHVQHIQTGWLITRLFERLCRLVLQEFFHGFARSMHLRTKLKPLECTPLLANPSTTSPAVMDSPVRIFDFSTAPTAKPAKSYSPAGYMPGISAVSPPISAQPLNSQPLAMPPTTAAAVSTCNLPQAK